MDERQALRELFGNGTPILTAQGYRAALDKVRRRDSRRATRIERMSGPLLKQAFPRRDLPLELTSLGTRTRLHLLPRNPWVATDAITIRDLLELPDDHVRPRPIDQIWQELVGEHDVADEEMLVLSTLAGAWLTKHSLAFGDDPTDVEGLPASYSDSAARTAKSDALLSDDSPVWLGEAAQAASNEAVLQAPLFTVAAAMVRRHQLPGTMAMPICAYVLTLNIRFLKGGSALVFDVRPSSGLSQDTGAFDVVVKGIDEYMTEAEWCSIFRVAVRPQQDRLLAQRGAGRVGRRARPWSRLAYSMDAYQSVVEEGISRTAAARIACEQPGASKDQRAVERDLADIDRLLRPETITQSDETEPETWLGS